jgi:transposase
MPAATQIPESRRAEMEEFSATRCSGSELRRFLCVWLRVEGGMSAVEIARAIKWSANGVRIVQRRFIEQGVAAFADRKRGRRTPPRMTFQEEEAFLDGFRAAAATASVLVVGDIKAAWEERLGRTVHKTTVYRMLERHGWRKVVPRPRHPKKDEEAGEAFKKGASLKGSKGRGQGRRGSR